MDLYINGNIHTMDGASTVCSAIAVSGGAICALCDSAELTKKYPDAKVHDLQGKTVIPGLIDTHAHMFMAAVSEADGEMYIPESVADLLADLKKRAVSTPAGEWIVYKNTYPLRLKEQRYPTMQELDAASPDNPVSVDGFYSAQLNSVALKMVDLTVLPAGGSAIRDNNGCLNGTLLNSFGYLCRFYPNDRKTTLEDAYIRAMQSYNEYGITTSIQGFSSFDEIRAMEKIYSEGRQTVRLRHTLRLCDCKRENLQDEINSIKPSNPEYSKICFIKDFIDGGFLTGTSLMEHGYKNIGPVFSLLNVGESWKGNYVTKVSELADSIRLAEKNKLQYCAHCVGSLAAQKLIEAYEIVTGEMPITGSRHALLHADFVDGDMLSRAKKLGLTLLFQPAWHYMDAQNLSNIMNENETSRFMPYMDILQSGVNAAAGSDHMVKLDANSSVNPFNPFIGLYNMVSCRGRDGKVYGANETIDRMNALLYYTRHAARICFDEDLIGSLEVGKRADFVVLDRNYFTCSENEIKKIKPTLTVVDGKEVAG